MTSMTDMSCDEVLDILDDHGLGRLAPAGKARLSAHLEQCDRCSNQWHALHVLESQSVPPVPPGLLAGTRRLVETQYRPPATGPRRLTWRTAGFAGALVAGAALAAVGIVSQTAWNGPSAASGQGASSTGAPGGNIAAQPAEPAAPAAAAAHSGTDGSTEAQSGAALPPGGGAAGGLLPDGEYFALLKVPPVYPPEAVSQGLAGSVVVEFTITAAGDVTGVEVVESTDTVFEQAAVDAARQFKYMPQISGGEPVPVPGVRNRLTFILDDAGRAPEAKYREMTGLPEPSMRPDFWEIVAPALSCASSGDLQCAELVLDEAVASHDLNAAEQRAALKFYGYIYAKLDDYERSIAAYEKALSIPGGWPADLTHLTVAHLYLKRHQYVAALERVEAYIEEAEAAEITAIAGAYQLVDRLRQLGAVVPASPSD